MHWTKTKPDREGWWWYENKAGGMYIVRVYTGRGGILMVYHMDGEYEPLSEISAKARWSSEPIAPPEEKGGA